VTGIVKNVCILSVVEIVFIGEKIGLGSRDRMILPRRRNAGTA